MLMHDRAFTSVIPAVTIIWLLVVKLHSTYIEALFSSYILRIFITISKGLAKEYRCQTTKSQPHQLLKNLHLALVDSPKKKKKKKQILPLSHIDRHIFTLTHFHTIHVSPLTMCFY